MAKIRRVIRKTQSAAAQGIEAQFWPVLVSVLVLGGFLLGIILIYLYGHPAFWPCLIGLPFFIGGAIIALWKISNRIMKRSTQMALTISVIAHVLFLILFVGWQVFARQDREDLAIGDIDRDKKVIVIPDLPPLELQKERPDFLKAPETDVPEPEVEEVEKQEQQEEKPQIEKQPLPVPEPEKTTEPKEVKRQEVAETAPRASQHQSKLSRQNTTAKLNTGMVAELPKVEQTRPPSKVEAETDVNQKQSTEQTVQKRDMDQQPTTVTEATNVQVAKRQEQETPQPTTSTATTMRQQLNEPNVTPVAQVDVQVENPTVPRKTADQTQPNATAQATKQQTDAPTSQRTDVEVQPERPQEVATNTQRREDPAEVTPNQPQTPVSTPDRPTPQTLRPTVDAVAQDVQNPTAAPQPSPRQPTPHEAPTSPTRTETQTPVARRAEVTPTPTTPSTEVTANAQPRKVQEAPSRQAEPTSQAVARQTSPKVAPQSSQVADVATPTNNTPTEAIANAQPSNTAASRQAATGAQATRADAEPTVSTPSTTSAPTETQVAQRQPRAEQAPQVATSNTSVNRQRVHTEATSSTNTTVSDTSVSQSQVASASPSPQPTASQLSRQPSSDPSATRAQTAMAEPTRSPTSAVPRPSTSRSQADQPSIEKSVAVTATPTRSQVTADMTSSPTPVESPTSETATSGAGNPSAQPAEMALAKSDAGAAGSGRTRNLDRAFPTAQGAAEVASNSANRPRATQTEAGPAMAPSQPAQISRSIASQQIPTATLTANTDEAVASAAGSQQPGQVTATASATTIRAASDAESGPVSASKGSVDVDMGPPKIVEDTNATSSRAAGGGQPTVNPKTQSRDVVRQEVGGAPQLTVATLEVDVAQTTPDVGGGQVSVEDLNIDATAAVRAEAGGGQPVSGGPTKAVSTGAPSEVSSADQIARLQTARAEAAETAPGETSAGGGDPSENEDEEKENRLARADAGGAPQVALSTPTVVDIPTSPAGQPSGGGQPEPGQVTGAEATAVAKTETAPGAPAMTGPASTAVSGPVADAGGGQIAGAATIGRAEAAQATPGSPATGGGTASPARMTTGPAFVANTAEVDVTFAGGPSGVGQPDVPAVDAAGTEPSRMAGGVTGPAVSGPTGAVAGDTVVASAAGTQPGSALGERQASAAADGPALAANSNAGAPFKQSDTVGLSAGSFEVAMVDVPGVNGSPVANPDASELLGDVGAGEVARQSGGGLIVNVDAVDGPGGLGETYTPEAGLNDRRARLDSPKLALTATSRFAKTEVGGDLGTNTTDQIALPKEGFGGRSGPGGPQTEESVEAGLVFLERHQNQDGSWSLNNFGSGPEYAQEKAMMNSDTAATGLALLAFQGAGYHHLEYRYKETVRKAIFWLVKHQKENGDLYVPFDKESDQFCWLYSHSIAALALCEAYGMTQDPNLKEAAQKSLDFIVETQNKDRGGWRYTPNRGSDTSVTGWMFMALHSGDLAGLEFPQKTYDGIIKWLDNSQASESQRHLYSYNYLAPKGDPEQSHGRLPSDTMSSVGLLMRLYTGWKRDNKHMVDGAEYLLQNLPNMNNKIERDTYYWYYATQVMAHMKGEYWETWNSRLHPMLLQTQKKSGPMAGSWNPLYPVEDRWGPHAGRIYVTCMNLLSLEVKYRLLPLYEETLQ